MSIDEDVVACAPQDRLQQVLINLVENAIKYSAPEQPVELVLENREQQVMIHVGDPPNWYFSPPSKPDF